MRRSQLDEDVFNMSVRKFLKKVGVTSQREIEQAVRDAVADGRLAPDASPKVAVTLKSEALGLEVDIDGSIDLK